MTVNVLVSSSYSYGFANSHTPTMFVCLSKFRVFARIRACVGEISVSKQLMITSYVEYHSLIFEAETVLLVKVHELHVV